jgi:hypothetical protein
VGSSGLALVHIYIPEGKNPMISIHQANTSLSFGKRKKTRGPTPCCHLCVCSPGWFDSLYSPRYLPTFFRIGGPDFFHFLFLFNRYGKETTTPRRSLSPGRSLFLCVI